tara:strand:- start:12746 stop:13009 length:264 start_codon:yes stop_codon:yes gene_type:complete
MILPGEFESYEHGGANDCSVHRSDVEVVKNLPPSSRSGEPTAFSKKADMKYVERPASIGCKQTLIVGEWKLNTGGLRNRGSGSVNRR